LLTNPFLTDLDSRAAVKGSRDPLGIQQIWTRLGRHVVGNLTTVSNSARDFTTLILGYHFAAQLAEELGPGSELATFLKWEQLAAYARGLVNKDWQFRGTEKVRKNLSESSRITLSEERAHQILGNQKIYGLWGLYTMAARESGMVAGDPPRLTPPARDITERLYLPMLEEGAGKRAQRIIEALRPEVSVIRADGRDAPMVRSIGQVLQRQIRTKEREFYRSHLLYGGPAELTEGRQRQLVTLVDKTLNRPEFAWSTSMVANFAKEARAHGKNWHPLAHRLERIRASEAVLAPVSHLFTHLLGLDEKPQESITRRLRDEWSGGLRTVDAGAFAELRSEIGEQDPATGDRWVGIANALSAGGYGELLTLLIEQNAAVMALRGGTPWIEKRQGKIHVRFRDEQGALPQRSEISSLWRFPYFLDSLRMVATALQEN
jgi:hypothetical protein